MNVAKNKETVVAIAINYCIRRKRFRSLTVELQVKVKYAMYISRISGKPNGLCSLMMTFTGLNAIM
jgi:hypothetical protein